MTETPKPAEITSYQKIVDSLHHLLDVPMKITIQLGNRDMKIREILELKQNTIVELPKSAGENIDVYINGRLIAYGEVLELEGNAGIRLTDLNISG